MLSIYYMSENDFVSARHLLSAASHIFGEWRIKNDTNVEQSEEMIEKVRPKQSPFGLSMCNVF